MFCVHCGKGLPEAARFCYSCGKAQAPSEASPGKRSDLLTQEENTPRPQPRRTALYVGGSLAALVVVGAVALALFLAGHTRDERSGAPQETPVPAAVAEPVAAPHPGFKARFECSMMGQPLALVVCIELSSISVVTGSGVREYNVMTLGQGRSDLDVELPEHFQIRASNSSQNPVSLRVTVRDRAGTIVFSDAAGPGRSISLQN